MHGVSLAANRRTNGQPLKVALPLHQDRFLRSHLFQEGGEQRAIDTEATLTVLTVVRAPFFQNQLPFTLRATMDLSIGVGDCGRRITSFQ